MDQLRQIIERAMIWTGSLAGAYVFPTLLVRQTVDSKPNLTERREIQAETAMAYLVRHGFQADRTRMDEHGYPGLFRKLNSAPPWVAVTPEDTEGPVPLSREQELRALYLQANATPEAALIARYEQYLNEFDEAGKRIGVHLPPDLALLMREQQLRDFRSMLQLARCLGPKSFETLYGIIFETYWDENDGGCVIHRDD